MNKRYYQVLKFKIIFLTFSFLVANSSFAERLNQEESQRILSKGRIINTITTKDPYGYGLERLTTYHVLFGIKLFICIVGYEFDRKTETLYTNKVMVSCKDSN